MATVQFLQIEPTTRCNFTCGFCVGRHMRQTDLPLDIGDRIFEIFDGLEAVELQGEGEPLLHRDFFRIAGRAAGAGAMISMITNGSLLSPARVEQLLAQPIERVGISLESPDSAQFKEIRGGSFPKVVEGIRRLKAARDARNRNLPVIGLNVTVLRSTLDQAEEIIDLYRLLGLDGGIWFQGLQDLAVYADTYGEPMRAEMLSDAEKHAVEDLRERFNLDDSIDKSGRDIGFYPRLFADLWNQPSTCPWLVKGGYVSAEGELMPCCHVKDTQWSFGNIRDSSADELLGRRNAMGDQLRNGVVPEPCRGCWVVDILKQSPRSPLAHEERQLELAF